MSHLERSVMLMLWKDIKNMPEYKNWHNYERGFTFEGKKYRYRCKFKVEDENLQLMDSSIEHEQQVIELVH